MISVEITRDTDGNIDSFLVKNHGDSYVCGAVSMLVINTVNSIETFTKQGFDCDYELDGAYVSFALKEPRDENAAILLKAMHLGLTGVREEYPDEINMKEM
ncbi:MAG: ribosomal-processing cysteine protease Prp [Defluviitaleaceae bacterium]|nr:ribosomal-processing cysteine protease Prp [Defluviitaleaceae bacterium]